ncbi:MAG: glycosyl hydrolase family 28-related protein [Verrucomicrobiota bacterium]
MKFLWPFLLLLVVVPSRLKGAAPAPDGTFSVAAFGAKGDGQNDDRAAIQQAIDAAIASGTNAVVSFGRGMFYRLGKQDDDPAALRLGGASGLTLSGNGATLLAHPSNRQLAIFDSKHVLIRDLLLDFNPLPFTQARVTDLALAQGTIRFRVEPNYDDPSVGAGDLYPDFKNSDAVFLDGATRAFTHEWGRVSNITALENHVFEVYG